MSKDYFNTLVKDIIENNDKEKTIKIIASKLNEKQLFNEKEMLNNNEKDKEIERLNNIINEIEAIIYNNQITGIEARLEIQERLDKLQELKGSDKE